MRILSIKVESEMNDCSVKDVLSKYLYVSDSLRSKIKQRNGSICVNGCPVYTNFHLHTGDNLCVDVSDLSKNYNIAPKEYPLNILYENDDFLVIDKQAGISVHPVKNSNEITLEHAIAYHLKDSNDNPHPVSRLDRGTTGIITIAKSGWSHNLLKISQQNGSYKKKYLALCIGTPKLLSGTINAPIGYFPGSKYKRMVRTDGVSSVSEYTVLKTLNDISLIQLIPITGRTHQLRVHMAYIGHPLLGDWLYGQIDERISRPALHSSEVTFQDVYTNKIYHFEAPYPNDMSRIIKQP